MNGEGGGPEGLSSEAILAAYALQNVDDDRRSSTSSVGGEGFYSPGGSVHSGGSGCGTGLRFSHSALDPPPASSCSHARSVPTPAAAAWHQAAGGGSCNPSLSPLGSLSPPASPTHRSILGPGGSGQQDSPIHGHCTTHHPAAAADLAAATEEGTGSDWQQLFSSSPPSVTFAPQFTPQYHQYQVLGGTGSPQLLGSPTEQQQQQQLLQQMLSPDSVALLASAAASGTSKHSTVQGAGAADFHHLQHMPSFGFAPHVSTVMQRRITSGTNLPQDPFAAAGLAAAGAAAAEATHLQLAAGERQRRQAAALEDQQQEGEDRGGPVCCGAAAEGKGVEEQDEGKRIGVSAEPTSSNGGTTDADELGLAEITERRQVKWYQRWSFWGRLLSFSLSLAFFLTGIVTLVVWPHVKLAGFDLWRWCFFLGCWPLIYWASVWAMWALTKFCEWRLFAARTAVYFLVGTRGALMLVMRSCLVLAAFAALFQTQPNLDEDTAVQQVFQFLIKLLGSMALMTVGNLIKKVLIKVMSTHFHKEAHFQRMQEALRKEYFLSVLSHPREHHDSMDSQGQKVGGDGEPRAKSFAKRWLSRQLLSKRVAAMQSLPTVVRSFSLRLRQRSQSDLLLVEGRQLSDGGMAGPDGGGLPAGYDPTAVATGGGFLPEKSTRSATAVLSSISVVVGAGVDPSSKSMPNLQSLDKALGNAPSFQQRQQPQQPSMSQDVSGSKAPDAGTAAVASQQAPRQSGLQMRIAAGAPAVVAQKRPPSRLSRSAVDGTPTVGSSCGEENAPAASGQLAQQLTRQLTPSDAAISEAARPELSVSLASRQSSGVSPLSAARQSFAFRVREPSHQPSLASLHSLKGEGGRAALPLQQLLDLGQTREQLRARHRRTSIVQMPPEELEKMHHIEKHIRKNQLKVTLVDQLGSLKGQAGAASNEQEARRVAYFLYHNLRASRKRNWIQQSDLDDFLPPQQAAEAFVYLDIDGNGCISAAEVKESVIKIFQERAHLALTLRDTKSVISKLERLLGAIIHTLFIFFYLAIFKIDVTQAWLTFSSIMLAFTFIFGNSIRTVFECVVWLFVVHPYDVGDTLVLTGENHRVEEITLLNTVLTRWDGARIYFPHSRLNNEQLFNLSRSANKSETLKLSLDLCTPLEVVEMLQRTVEAHVKDKPGDFSGASSVNVRALGDPMKLALSIWYEYNHNGVDSGRCGRARSALYMVVAAALNAAHVQFTLPPFPGDVVAARAHTALEAQAELATGMGLPPVVTGAAA